MLIKDKVQCGVTQSPGVKSREREILVVVLALTNGINFGHGV